MLLRSSQSSVPRRGVTFTVNQIKKRLKFMKKALRWLFVSGLGHSSNAHSRVIIGNSFMTCRNSEKTRLLLRLIYQQQIIQGRFSWQWNDSDNTWQQMGLLRGGVMRKQRYVAFLICTKLWKWPMMCISSLLDYLAMFIFQIKLYCLTEMSMLDRKRGP